jgi:pimeloyl-ACP methyl ester carboxylesterase
MNRTLRITAIVLLALGSVLGIGIAATWAPDIPVEALEARWAPPPSTFITVQGLRVHVRDVGPRDDAEPIVLLHGTSASLHTWEGWTTALQAQHRVIAFDLPGFGLTGPNASGDYREEAYARFVIDVLDALELPRVVLGGNSLGGQIAWNVAAIAPQRVAALVLVDAAGYAMTSTSIPLGFRMARVPGLNRLLGHVLPRGLVESSLRNVYGDPSRVTPALVDRYVAMTRREGNRRAVVQRFAQSNWGQGDDRIRTLKLPTLILWGGRDRLIPPEHGEHFARDIAGSSLVRFDDLGHVPHEEDPARTVAALQRFLALRTTAAPQ